MKTRVPKKKVVHIIIVFCVIMTAFLIYLKNQPVDMKGWSLFQVREYAAQNNLEIEYETTFSNISFGEVISNRVVDENKYLVVISIGEDLTERNSQYVWDYINNLKAEGYVEEVEEIPSYFDELIPKDSLKKYSIDLLNKKITMQFSNGVDPIVTNINFLAVGNVLLHQSLYEKALLEENKYDFNPFLEKMSSYLLDSSLAMVNQASITGGEELGLSGETLFNSPFSITDNLVNMGFNMFATANPFSFDFGEKAIDNAKNYYDNFEKIVMSGINNDPEIEQIIPLIEKDGIKIAFLSYTYNINKPLIINKNYLVNLFSRQKAEEDIINAKQVADVIIVNLFWKENTDIETQKEDAQWLANMGVNVIIGNDNSSIQPVEFLSGEEGNQTFVAYSLGNFLTGYEDYKLQMGVILQLDINHILKIDGKEVVIENVRLIPTITDLETKQIINLIDSKQTDYFLETKEMLTSYTENITVLER